MAEAKGNGVCLKCNGGGRIWREGGKECSSCGGSGKCSICKGTGINDENDDGDKYGCNYCENNYKLLNKRPRR